MTRRSRGGVSNVDRALPKFLADVTEQVQAGTSITTILKQQARGGERGGLFGQLRWSVTAGHGRDHGGGVPGDPQAQPLPGVRVVRYSAAPEAGEHGEHAACCPNNSRRGSATFQKLGSTGNTPHVLRQMTKFMSGILATKLDVAKPLSMGVCARFSCVNCWWVVHSTPVKDPIFFSDHWPYTNHLLAQRNPRHLTPRANTPCRSGSLAVRTGHSYTHWAAC